jgi:hypothetical protein
MRFCILILYFFVLSGCTPKVGGNQSTISLNLPSLNELNSKPANSQKVSTLSIDAGDIKWENACFMVSVTASDIPPKSASTCDLPSGVFYGSVAPGANATTSTVSIEVPKGSGRRVAVYAYFRHSSAEACAIHDNLNRYSKDRVGILGLLKDVSLEKDNETLDIDISLPTQMLDADYSLPPACTRPAGTSGRLVSGSQGPTQTLVNGYKVRTSAGGADKEFRITPNGFKVHRKRGTSQ